MKTARYLLAGTANTFFGYFTSLGLYYSLSNKISLLAILGLASVLSITFSFLTYKLYVFKTSGNWLREYIKCYFVYGFTALFSTSFIWFLVEKNNVKFWMAQGLAIFLIVALSYLLHNKYTFSNSNE